MNCEKAPTGKPSEDRRWMQYYPEMNSIVLDQMWWQSIIMEKISPGKLFSRNPKNVRDH